MKLVASTCTITTRDEFYLWLEKLPWLITLDEKRHLAEQAKYSRKALWSYKTGFVFW